MFLSMNQNRLRKERRESNDSRLAEFFYWNVWKEYGTGQRKIWTKMFRDAQSRQMEQTNTILAGLNDIFKDLESK